MFWLVADKGITLLSGLLVGAYVARYLGPENLGLLAFGLAVYAMLLPIVSLGFDQIIIRDYLIKTDQRSETFWTAFSVRLLAGILCFLFASLLLRLPIAASIPHQDIQLICILLLPLLCSPLNLVPLLFEAEVQSKYFVWLRFATTLLSATIKVSLVATAASLTAFAYTQSFAVAFSSIVGLGIGFKLGLIPLPPKFARTKLKALFAESWPLLIAGIGVTLYMNSDLVMLKSISGNASAGKYSIAVTLASAFHFIPLALASTFFPAILQLRKKGDGSYIERFFEFLRLNALVAYLITATALLVIPKLIGILFGIQFEQSSLYFCIHVSAFLFIFLGVAREKHLVAIGLTRFSMLATILGLLTNIGLNLILIPRFGGVGAALATVFSHAVSGVFSSFLYIKTREVGRLQLAACLSPFPIKFLSDLWKSHSSSSSLKPSSHRLG